MSTIPFPYWKCRNVSIVSKYFSIYNSSTRLQDVAKATDFDNTRSEVDRSKIYRPQHSIAQQQQYSSQNFNWSPQYILNQSNHSRSTTQQQTEHCSTYAPYLSMRQSNSQRIGMSSQSGLNYSRYSGGGMTTQSRYAIYLRVVSQGQTNLRIEYL